MNKEISARVGICPLIIHRRNWRACWTLFGRNKKMTQISRCSWLDVAPHLVESLQLEYLFLHRNVDVFFSSFMRLTTWPIKPANKKLIIIFLSINDTIIKCFSFNTSTGLQTPEQFSANCQNHRFDRDRIDIHLRCILVGLGLSASESIMRSNANIGQHFGEGIDVGDLATGKQYDQTIRMKRCKQRTSNDICLFTQKCSLLEASTSVYFCCIDFLVPIHTLSMLFK